MTTMEKALVAEVLQSLREANLRIQKFVDCGCSDDEEEWIVTYYFVRAGEAIDLVAEAGCDDGATRCYFARSGSVVSIEDVFYMQLAGEV